MEMVAEKAFGLFRNHKTDVADTLSGKMEVLKFACHAEIKECVSWAKAEFDKWKNSKTDKNM